MKISSTSNITENKIKALLAGPSGSGKTYQARLLKEYRPLVISAESGLLSLAGSGIDYIDISKDDAGELIPKELRVKRLMEVYGYAMTAEAKSKYDLLYIDSLTELSQVLFDHLHKEFPERKDSLVLFGTLKQKTRDALKAFRDMPHYHVVFTCLTEIDKDDNGRRYPAFSVIGGIKDQLAQFFDLVAYIRITADGSREIVCNATDVIVAKDRSSNLLPIEEPDLGKVFRKILNEPIDKSDK